MTASTTASASPTPSCGSGVSQETLASKPGLEAPPKGEIKMTKMLDGFFSKKRFQLYEATNSLFLMI